MIFNRFREMHDSTRLVSDNLEWLWSWCKRGMSCMDTCQVQYEHRKTWLNACLFERCHKSAASDVTSGSGRGVSSSLWGGTTWSSSRVWWREQRWRAWWQSQHSSARTSRSDTRSAALEWGRALSSLYARTTIFSTQPIHEHALKLSLLGNEFWTWESGG